MHRGQQIGDGVPVGALAVAAVLVRNNGGLGTPKPPPSSRRFASHARSHARRSKATAAARG